MDDDETVIVSKRINTTKKTWQRFQEIARERGAPRSQMIFTILVNEAWDRLQKKKDRESDK